MEAERFLTKGIFVRKKALAANRTFAGQGIISEQLLRNFIRRTSRRFTMAIWTERTGYLQLER